MDWLCLEEVYLQIYGYRQSILSFTEIYLCQNIYIRIFFGKNIKYVLPESVLYTHIKIKILYYYF